jgi:hypothetical protein
MRHDVGADTGTRAVPISFTLQLLGVQGGDHDIALHTKKLSN